MIRFLFRLVARALALLCLLFVATFFWIVADGLKDPEVKADVAVILGMAVLDKRTPGPVVRERLERAIELFKAQAVRDIVVSGANRDGGYNESETMANYLVRRGVPARHIVRDPLGKNTRATAVDVAAMLATHRWKTVIVVTHYYHITRAKLAFRQAGLEVVGQAHAGILAREDGALLAREVVAIWYYILCFGWPISSPINR